LETCFNYVEKDNGFFSSDELRWINKIHKLKEQYPDDVKILAEPDVNDGCIYCKLPTSWLKIQPKRKVELSEERKDVLRERLARMRQISSELQD